MSPWLLKSSVLPNVGALHSAKAIFAERTGWLCRFVAVIAVTALAVPVNASAFILTDAPLRTEASVAAQRVDLDQSATSGEVANSVQGPANDHRANAFPITLFAGSTSATGTNVNATVEPGELGPGGEQAFRTVWWKWTAPTGGTLTVTTAGSNFDTMLSVWVNGTYGWHNRAGNDDVNYPHDLSSATALQVERGMEYFIGVDGYGGATGQIRLNLTFVQAEAPVVSVQPERSPAVPFGATVTLVADGYGVPEPTFRWQRSVLVGHTLEWFDLAEGGNFSGVNTRQLTIANSTPDLNEGEFRCVLTNVHGSAFSERSYLRIAPNVPPIVSMALSAERHISQTITITLSAVDPEGQLDFANLWVQTPQRGWLTLRADNTVVASAEFTAANNSISGPGTQTRTFTFTMTDGPGDYRFQFAAADTAGARTDAAPQVITVIAAPIVAPPAAPRRMLSPGESTTLSINAAPSGGSVTYQWLHNGVALPGATGAALSLSAVTEAHAGYYVARVTDANGTTFSSPIFVQVMPLETQVVAWGANHLEQATVPLGLQDAVAVAAAETSSVVLRRDGTLMNLGSATWMRIGNPPRSSAGFVAVKPGASHFLALAADGRVHMHGGGGPQLPAALANVVDVAAGLYTSFVLKADGTVAGWRYIPHSGATETIETPAGVSDVVALAAGEHHVLALRADGRVLAWGGGSPAAIAVPESLSNVVAIAAGRNTSFAITGDGQVIAWGDESIAWMEDVRALSGVKQLAAGWDFAVVLKHDGTVAAVGVDQFGNTAVPPGLSGGLAVSARHQHALALRRVEGDTAPVILTQPESTTALEGEAAEFSVVAVGSPPLRYQWRRNGTWIIGATGPTYRMPAVSPGDATAQFDVLVSNHLGSVASAKVSVTVKLRPVVSLQTEPRHTVAPGASVTLSVGATGNGAIQYQWYRRGQPLPGQTSTTLTLSNLTPEDSGAYWAVATDANGPGYGPPTFVTVMPATTRTMVWGTGHTGPDQVPADLGSVVAVCAAFNQKIVIRRDGTLAAWTIPEYPRWTPSHPMGFVAVTSDNQKHAALAADGSMVMWADYGFDGTPLPSDARRRFVEIAAGYGRLFGLRVDGTLGVWEGNQGFGAAPPEFTNLVAIAANSSRLIGAKADGTVVTWDYYRGAAVPPPVDLTDVTEVTCGGLTFAARKADGTVVAWGGGAGDGVPADLSGVRALAAEAFGVIARRENGQVVGWGDNRFAQFTIPSGLRALQVSMAYNFAMAVHDPAFDTAPAILSSPLGRTVVEGQSVAFSVSAAGVGPLSYQWRLDGVPILGATAATLTIAHVEPVHAGIIDVVVSNHIGQATSAGAALGVVPLPQIALQVPARQLLVPGEGTLLRVGVVSTGATSMQWYRNGRPIAGANRPVLPIANAAFGDSGFYFVDVTDEVGTRRSAPIFVRVGPIETQWVNWGAALSAVNPPATWTDVIEVASSSAHVVLRANGQIAAWGGSNSSGEATVPAGLSDVVAVGAGPHGSGALTSDGRLFIFGASFLQPPADLPPVVAFAMGRYHVVALLLDGTVRVWGNNIGGVIPVPDDLTEIVAVAAGDVHCVAVRANGTVVAWGNNDLGQCSVPAGLQNVVAVSAGARFSFALKADGTVTGWGSNSSGELSFPPLSNVVRIRSYLQSSLALRTDGTVVGWGSSHEGISNVPTSAQPAFAIGIGSSRGFAVLDGRAPGNRAPFAALAVSAERHVNEQVRLDVVVGDVDGNHSYANLWVQSPTVGWRALRADNSLVLSGEFSAAHAVASQAGAHVRSFVFDDGPGEYRFRLRALDSLGAMSEPVEVAVLVEERPPNSGFDRWRALNFPAPAVRDVTQTGPLADFDGDGLSNLLEYALGSDPSDAASGAESMVMMDGGQWTFEFDRPGDRSDLTYAVEVSTDLINWTSAGVTLERVTGGKIETWQARHPGGVPHLFFRLRVQSISQ